MTATLLLVRHAGSVPPTPGGPDEHHRPLSPYGLVQAAHLAGALVAYRPARMLSSPYLRAVQTVQPAADRLGLPVRRRDALREWASGIGPTPDWQPHYRRCWDDPTYAMSGGESHAALGERVAAALATARAATADGEVTVVASHGGWISRALAGLGCSVDADFWFAMPMPAVYAVTYDGDRVAGVTGPGLNAPTAAGGRVSAIRRSSDFHEEVSC